MQYKNWSTLKTASKVAFKKIAASGNKKEYIVLESKRYHPETGVELTATQHTITLKELETKKAELTANKAKLTTEITELGKMITEIKKV